MSKTMTTRKNELKKGEMIPLCFDECAKIMFGNPEKLEPLTLLLSKTLGIDYKDLEGRIELVPTASRNKTLGYKKTDRDIVVYINETVRDKIIIEVNMSDYYYDTIMNKSIYYLAEVFGTGLKESKKYDEIEPTFLICFNTFYVDNIHKKMFDEYYFRNEEGYILTEKERILNINIAECYLSWYNGTYKALDNRYQKDLLILCAAMYTKKTEEFIRCISEISMERYLKEEMEEVCTRMNDDEELKVRYYDFLEETRALKEAIIREEKRKSKKEGLAEGRAKGFNEGRVKGLAEGRAKGLNEGHVKGLAEGRVLKEKEMIINMCKKNIDFNIIADVSGLSVEEIRKIIENK